MKVKEGICFQDGIVIKCPNTCTTVELVEGM